MVAKNRKQFEFKLGKAGFLIFVLGMAIGLFATFLFGVTIGKNIDLYPASITGYIPTVIGERFGWKSEKTTVATEEGKKEIARQAEGEFDLTFYDTLSKKKDGDIILQRPGAKMPATDIASAPPPSGPVPAGKTAAVVPGQPPLPPEMKSAPLQGGSGTAKGTPPAVMAKQPFPPAFSDPGAVKPRQPDHVAAEKVRSGKGKFAVQLASYKDKPKAEQLSKKLTALGYHPAIVSVEVPQQGMRYRVTLRGYDSLDQAKQVSAGVAAKVPGVKGVVHQGD